MTKEQKVYLRLILYYFGLLTIGSIVVGILYTILLMIIKGPDISENELLSQMTTMTSILEALILLFVVYVARKKANLQFRRISFSKQDMLKIIIGLAFIFLTEIILGNLAEFYHWNAGSENEKAVREMLTANPIVMMISTVLVAPILEEFIFRKSIIGHLFKNHPSIGWISSSLLFGLAHMMSGFGLLAYIQYSLIGAVLGWVYLKTKKSEVNTTLHILNNAIAVFLPFL